MSNFLKSGLKKSTLKTSKKSSFLTEIEKIYGFEFHNQICICEDRINLSQGLPDCLTFKWGCVPPNDCIKRTVDFLDISKCEINSLDDIYKLSKSGFNSYKHSLNKNWNIIREKYTTKGLDLIEIQNKYYKQLIPVILLKKNGVSYSFRVDNPYIREMFKITEDIISDYKNYDDKEEIMIRDENFIIEHKEYLDDFFN